MGRCFGKSIIILGASCLLSCVRTVDVLVAGGGASGVCAGIQSASMGVSTMIVEETPWLGGMLTSAGVSCIDGNYRLRSGLFGEFVDSLAVRYGGYEALKTGWVSNICFEPHVGAEVFDSMTDRYKDCLEVRRCARIGEISRSHCGWKVVVTGPEGNKEKVRAKVLIDCTELGDVAAACGAGYEVGMDSRAFTGENIAPEEGNDVIQDMTFVAVLKDYGEGADMTLPRPCGYDSLMFDNCAINPLNNPQTAFQTLWKPEEMISYGALQNGKYMINWPIRGNDRYAQVIEADEDERHEEYMKAKHFTECFVYFIQTVLGMKNLGLCTDEFPTGDGFAMIPYHRESRRIHGRAFFTIDAAARPYEYDLPYYRTGIAVGDYAVDHHHFRNPDWRNLPDLHFYPVPSFSVPYGSMIPEDVENLIVAEKSISVSNIMNGATRLQPVVMQLGQAAGAAAASAVIAGKDVSQVEVRHVQGILLECGCYLMPYLDLSPSDSRFAALQRIGASGVMRGEGRNAGWSNETWFRCSDPLRADELFFDDFGIESPFEGTGMVSAGEFVDGICTMAGLDGECGIEIWKSLGLGEFNPSDYVSRLEAAVLIDSLLDPFSVPAGLDGTCLQRLSAR